MRFIGEISKTALVCCLVTATAMAFAQARSPKRGICWDEKTQKFSDAPIEKLLPGISWIYTWGEAPQGSAANLGNDNGIAFAPMAFGRGFNENAIRNYVKEHPSVRYLLGFNEPNFASQANMSPGDAAALWPVLEDIADEYGLKLVAPALNFSGEQIGGRIWGIYDWLDEFIRIYKANNGRLPKTDCLALHCYMNWYGATTWFVNEYIYSDIFKNGNDAKYPNLVELLSTIRKTTGQYPRMMLTEFCSWEGNKDGFVTNEDNQIDQMTQRIQKMEQSDIVEGYAWFMANTDASHYPYMSAFLTNSASSELSTLGKVLVNMSSFDVDKYYLPGELILAKDYVDATTDGQIVRLRPNTEEGNVAPLQIELTAADIHNGKYSAATYQINVPAAGSYTFTIHAKGAGARLGIHAVESGSDTEMEIAGNSGGWANYKADVTLAADQNTVKFTNLSSVPVLINTWKFDANTGIVGVGTQSDATVYTVYNIQGIRLGTYSSGSALSLEKGSYILVAPDGTTRKIII